LVSGDPFGKPYSAHTNVCPLSCARLSIRNVLELKKKVSVLLRLVTGEKANKNIIQMVGGKYVKKSA
jgi:hypothetical protein